jgi:hypothetical protein
MPMYICTKCGWVGSNAIPFPNRDVKGFMCPRCPYMVKEINVSVTDDPKDPGLRELDETGRQKSYLVLSEEERAKGFVRPVRRTYTHLKCGGTTTMNEAIAETYAREPAFYGATYCCVCCAHFPVGEDGEFVWYETDEKVGT